MTAGITMNGMSFSPGRNEIAHPGAAPPVTTRSVNPLAGSRYRAS